MRNLKVKNYGIYITDNLIRFAQAARGPKKQTAIVEQEINIASLKPEEIVAALKKFLKKNRIAPEYFTLGIPRTQFSIRYLNLPPLNDREINQRVRDELTKLFPYKLEELIFDYTLIQKSPNGYADIMLVVIQKEVLLRQLSILKQVGLIPDAIELGSLSLFNQFCQPQRRPANYLCINFDDGFLDIMYINEGRLTFSQGANFKGGLEKEEFLKNLNLTIAILKDKSSKIDAIVLSGKGVDLKDFSRSLEQALPYKVEIDAALDVMPGLVLKGGQDTLRMDFMPEEFKIQKKKEKRQKTFFYLITLLLLNLSLITNIVFLKIKGRDEYLYLLKSEVKKVDAQTAILQRNMQKVQLLQNYFNANRLTLVLLSELYRLAPEGVYLNSLSISDKIASRTMVITGQAKDSETVLKFANALKGSSFINKADIDYISKKSLAAEETVEFKITVRL